MGGMQATPASLTHDYALEPTGPDVARYPMRRAAAAAGLHPQTLRDYERRGLVHPDRTDGGMRLYREKDIEIARHVRQLTDDGFGFKAIDRIVGLERKVRKLIAQVRIVEDQNMRLSARLSDTARQAQSATPSTR